MGSLLLFLAAVSSLLAPPRTQLISQRCSLPRCGPPHPAQCSSEPPELSCVLQAAGVASSPERVTQLTSGFCNAVYLVEMAREQQIGGERIVVVKLFSPLAKLRLSPAEVLRCDGNDALSLWMHARGAPESARIALIV
eukprot:scaffold246911_cov33-Tisochrysis_lutea.AAC.3